MTVTEGRMIRSSLAVIFSLLKYFLDLAIIVQEMSMAYLMFACSHDPG